MTYCHNGSSAIFIMMPSVHIVFLSGGKTLLWAMDIPHIADRLIGIVRLLHVYWYHTISETPVHSSILFYALHAHANSQCTGQQS